MTKIFKITRYVISGGTSVVANLVVLYSLVQILKIWYLTSAIISFCVSAIVSYVLQKFFTFKDYSTKGMHLQFSHFFLYALAMLGVNTTLMYIFVDVFGFWYLLSQVVITAITAFLNYFIFNKFIFNKSN